MKKRTYLRIAVLTALFALCGSFAYAQGWTSEELRQANTAASCTFLSQVEKDVVLYNNLARMYPAKFAQLELRGEAESENLSSLRAELMEMTPLRPYTINRIETNSAKCWAGESGRRGLVGHDRVGCGPDHASNFWGENCSYGMDNGRAIIIQLLVDKGVPNLGHRRNCLNASFRSLGVGFASHSVWRYCCVMDFSDQSGEDYTAAVVATTSQVAAPMPSPASTTGQTYTPEPETTRRGTETTATPEPETRSNFLERYFEYSGRHALYILGVGYSYSCANGYHLVNASLFDFRTTMIGFSLLNVEMAVKPFKKRFSWKPQARVYIPTTKYLVVVPYGGAQVDMSYIGTYFSETYDYRIENEFYVNAFVGVAANFSILPNVPLEVKAEYRFPIRSVNLDPPAPKGFYLGANIYFGLTYKKK